MGVSVYVCEHCLFVNSARFSMENFLICLCGLVSIVSVVTGIDPQCLWQQMLCKCFFFQSTMSSSALCFPWTIKQEKDPGHLLHTGTKERV